MSNAIPRAAEFRSMTARYATCAAVHDRGGATTFAELGERAAGVAAALLCRCVAVGQPVATCFRNRAAAIWGSYGVMLSGACEVPINASLSAAEIGYCARLAKVELVLTESALAEPFEAAGLAVLLIDEVEAAALIDVDLPELPPDAVARITFSSGTTGRPKAIVSAQEARWIGHLNLRTTLPYLPEGDSAILLMTPIAHGASLLAHAYLAHGAGVYLLQGVEVPEVEKLLRARAVDALFGPPTVLAKLCAAFKGRSFPGLRAIFCGTAPLTPAVHAAARDIFGPVIRITYGKSEVHNPITYLQPAEVDQLFQAAPDTGPRDLCVGWSGPGVEIEVCDEGGNGVSAGDVGRIMIRAPHMARGWYDEDGFHDWGPRGFHDTGDMGYLAHGGRLHLVGRAADVIKTGGYKIYPAEIERAIGAANAPHETAVVGLPSDYWGEVIVAVTESATDDWPDTAAEAAVGLTSYKRPRAYLQVEALPRNGQGKIVRRLLVDDLLRRYRLIDGPYPRLEPLDAEQSV